MKRIIILHYVKSAWKSVLSLFVKPTRAGKRERDGENENSAEHRFEKANTLPHEYFKGFKDMPVEKQAELLKGRYDFWKQRLHLHQG